MSTPVKLSDDLVKSAKTYAAAMSRSVPKQIEHWARIGRMAEENPDLSYEFIEGLLIAMEEVENGDVTEFVFEGKQQ